MSPLLTVYSFILSSSAIFLFTLVISSIPPYYFLSPLFPFLQFNEHYLRAEWWAEYGDENLVQLADHLCRGGDEEGHDEEGDVGGHPLEQVPLTLHYT